MRIKEEIDISCSNLTAGNWRCHGAGRVVHPTSSSSDRPSDTSVPVSSLTGQGCWPGPGGGACKCFFSCSHCARRRETQHFRLCLNMALSARTVLSVQPLLESVSTSMKGNVDRGFLICSKCWIICVYLLKTKIVKPVLDEKRSCTPDRSAQSPYVRQDACMMPVVSHRDL